MRRSPPCPNQMALQVCASHLRFARLSWHPPPFEFLDLVRPSVRCISDRIPKPRQGASCLPGLCPSVQQFRERMAVDGSAGDDLNGNVCNHASGPFQHCAKSSENSRRISPNAHRNSSGNAGIQTKTMRVRRNQLRRIPAIMLAASRSRGSIAPHRFHQSHPASPKP